MYVYVYTHTHTWKHKRSMAISRIKTDYKSMDEL